MTTAAPVINAARSRFPNAPTGGRMPMYYTVKQGEHLSRLAHQYGFSDYCTIWNHPQNAELKRKRNNPNVLYPGDTLFIPDRELREEVRPTDQCHRFVLSRPQLKLRLVLEDQYEKPIANAACMLAINADFRNITTDGYGKIEQDIPADAENAMLIIMDSQTAFDSIQIPILIGHLDPVEEFSGQWGRLTNLGYLTGPPVEERSEDFRSAVEEFQCEHGLTVDGRCGLKTQAKLKQVHGC
jgi:N-acetylmuramoyl-L-alanine amidase